MTAITQSAAAHWLLGHVTAREGSQPRAPGPASLCHGSACHTAGAASEGGCEGSPAIGSHPYCAATIGVSWEVPGGKEPGGREIV